ncbi:DNA-processing protein DprA [Pseudomonas capeferrum]
MKAGELSVKNREYWRSEKVAFLALSSLKGIGFWTLYKLAKSGVSFKEVLRSPEAKLLEKLYDVDEAAAPLTEQQDALWQKGLQLARSLFADDVKLIFKDEAAFPEKLRCIPDAPYWIFVQGDLSILSNKSVAVVGTRQPSDDGVFLSKLVLAALEKLKCVTVSGLALGVDQLAHIGSLRYGLKTIAVLGTGILENYPKGSEVLRKKILDSGGSIVSEYLPQQSYSAENFIRRNRLQAALCDLLIPVEWSTKSGTAHTVRFAAKYGKGIVNVYMPLTYDSKPELAFSENQLGAISIEMPAEFSAFINHAYDFLGADLFVEQENPKRDDIDDEFYAFYEVAEGSVESLIEVAVSIPDGVSASNNSSEQSNFDPQKSVENAADSNAEEGTDLAGSVETLETDKVDSDDEDVKQFSLKI